MSELELQVTPAELQATLTYECPECGLEAVMAVSKASVRPTCPSCGWTATFSLKLSF